MIVTYIVILLSFSRNKKEKRFPAGSNPGEGFYKNRTFIINKKTTSTVACPESGNPAADSDKCTAAIKGVGSVLATTPYSKNEFETAVNKFITECTTSACIDNCKTLISAKDFTTVATGFATSFVVCGGPTPVVTNAIAGTACDTPNADTPTTCEEKYDIVLTKTSASTETTAWNAEQVKTAINEFITACPTTSCKTGCTPVISLKNVATEYAGLKIDFTAQCNPNPEIPSTNTGRGFRLFKVTTSLIAMSIGASFVQLLFTK